MFQVCLSKLSKPLAVIKTNRNERKVMKKSKNWSKFLIEFISVFIAVVFAFALNNWNDNRRDNNTEKKILSEISNGLKKDLDDIKLNISGHKEGVNACKYWRRIINNNEFSQDSFYALLLLGFGFKFLLEIFVSIGTNIGIIPVTGLPLPFLSFGGTSIIMTLFSIGVICSTVKKLKPSIKAHIREF